MRLKGGDAGSSAGWTRKSTPGCRDLPGRSSPASPAASAAAASLGQSLTRRGRNSDLRLVTAHDMAGLCRADWRALAAPGGHGALHGQARRALHPGAAADARRAPEMDVAVVENASCPDQRALSHHLDLAEMERAGLAGPALILLGWPRRHAPAALPDTRRHGGLTMPRPFPQGLTANDLLEGDVIYRTPRATGSPRSGAGGPVHRCGEAAELDICRAAAETSWSAPTWQTPPPGRRPRTRPFPRGVPRPRPVQLRPWQAGAPQESDDVSLLRFRPRFPCVTRNGAVPRAGGAPLVRRADRGRIQAPAPDEWPLSATARLHAARRHPLRHAGRRKCASWPMWPTVGTRATAISPRARTSSSTGRACATCPTCWMRWPRWKCTPSRHPATASAT